MPGKRRILNRNLDSILQQKIRIGTCAWSYEDWRGVFYPEHLPHNRWLEFYSQHFPAVEVDSTFYHAPSAKTAEHWLEQTPDDFRFTCKMPKEITHELRLRDCTEKVAAFLEGIEPLLPKLGCVLIQLPPSMKPKQDEHALKEFLAWLPPAFRFAVEFRHSDWHQPRIASFLEQHRICRVWSDTTPLQDQNMGAFEPQPQTSDFLYIRLLGDLSTKYAADGSRRHRYGKLMWPRESSLENWVLKIQKHLAESEHAYVFCANHFEGFAPLTCGRISRRLGVPVELPCSETNEPPTEKQMTLL
jgi:uncharacterized protein YecE (DUF72 family)